MKKVKINHVLTMTMTKDQKYFYMILEKSTFGLRSTSFSQFDLQQLQHAISVNDTNIND